MADTPVVREKPAVARAQPVAKPSGPLGARIERKEDQRFLIGAGKYTDDIDLQHQSHGVFVRSTHAHARLKNVRTDAAKQSPGVLAVYTYADLPSTVGGLPCGWLITGIDGKPMKEPKHPLLATGKVRCVGDPVAIVVAETYEQAKDAAMALEVEYAPLPAVVDVRDARGSAAVVHDEAPDNTCYVWALGDEAAVDR